MSGKGSYRYKDVRKLLDQLLGEDRNGESDALAQKAYSDPEFCRAFLCGMCPHEMFLNTKNELGDCPKRHNESKRRDYELAVANGSEPGYEQELYHILRRLVDDCNRRVARGQARLLETQGPEDEDATSIMIKDAMKQVEELGEAGDVDASMALLAQVQALKEQKVRDDKAKKAAEAPDGMLTAQRLRVCESCASFLSLYDNEKRLADHYSGKLHQSFVIIRRKIEQLEKERHKWARAPFTPGAPPNVFPGGPPPHFGGPPPHGHFGGTPPEFAGGPPPPHFFNGPPHGHFGAPPSFARGGGPPHGGYRGGPPYGGGGRGGRRDYDRSRDAAPVHEERRDYVRSDERRRSRSPRPRD